jgi:hypothetical protein
MAQEAPARTKIPNNRRAAGAAQSSAGRLTDPLLPAPSLAGVRCADRRVRS